MSKGDSISMSVIRRLPRYYRFVTELPHTATGKKQHYLIKKQAREDLKNGLLLRK